LASLWHPCKFQQFSRLGSVTALHSSSGRQQNFAALNRERQLYSAGRPTRWALAHISSFFSFLTYSQPSQTRCVPYFHTWCGFSVNLRRRSETCCTLFTENAGPKKSPSAHHRTTLLGCVFTTRAHIDNWKKNLLNSNISSTCPHNMANVGPLTVSLSVWGNPAHFNGFRVLAALLHSTLVVSVSQTLQR